MTGTGQLLLRTLADECAHPTSLMMSSEQYRESLRRYKPNVFVDGRKDPMTRR